MGHLIHVYKPGEMSLPYVEEMNKWIMQSPEPLINCEWDNEYAPEVYERMMGYIKHDPERIHVGPYLTNIYFQKDGTPILFWAHRLLKEQVELRTVEEKFTKISKTIRAVLRYPAWVQGGESEVDIVCLGYTYFPKSYWMKIYPEIRHVDWRLVDIEISARMLRDKQKALVHWDCVVNHTHVGIREVEKAIFRKWVGADKTPLTGEEKEFLMAKVGVDKLPRYHGFLTEPMMADVETRKKRFEGMSEKETPEY